MDAINIAKVHIIRNLFRRDLKTLQISSLVVKNILLEPIYCVILSHVQAWYWEARSILAFLPAYSYLTSDRIFQRIHHRFKRIPDENKEWFARSFFFDFRIFHRLYFEKRSSFTLHSTRCNTNSSYDSPVALSARLSNSSKTNISSFHLFPAFSSPTSVGYCPYHNCVPFPPRYCKWTYISYSFSLLGFNCSVHSSFLRTQ